MNSLDVVRERLEACFILNSYAPDGIKKLAGIRMLSQIWIEVPAWYIWLHQVPGAFMVEASDSYTWENVGVTLDSARFVVRYFPPADSELMANFSDQENHLRNSSLFDETGTPVYEQLGVVRQGYFKCAVIEFHFSRSDGTVLMLLETDSTLGNELCRTTLAANCTSLYESLVGMYSLYYQYPPGNSYLFGINGLSTLQALSFSKGDSSAGDMNLRHYLGGDGLDTFCFHPAKERDWQNLALITPESLDSPGCGCCCGH